MIKLDQKKVAESGWKAEAVNGLNAGGGDMNRYTVRAQSGYAETTWTNRRRAISCARSITDSTNSITSVYDDWAADPDCYLIAQYRYTPERGGHTFRAQV